MDVIVDKGKDKEITPIVEHTTGNTWDHTERERTEEQAAMRIQRAWRGHSQWKKRLSSDARWKDALVNTKQKQVRTRYCGLCPETHWSSFS